MKMMVHILQKLWCEPCLILPSMHKQICEIVYAHMNGSAHDIEGIHGQFDTAPKSQYVQMTGRDRSIAILLVHGVIDQKVAGLGRHSGAIGVERIEEDIAALIEDESVEGIILDIDSPGGGITGVPELSESIASFTQIKPIISFTDSTMASAAYWIAAGATEIIASKSAYIGSIGAYSAIFDQSRQYEMHGIKTELFKTGKFKAMGIAGIELTDDQREMMQSRVDQVMVWFLEFLDKHRDLDKGSTEGQVFFGPEALDNGLIDEVGSISDAVNEMQELIDAGVTI